MKKLIFLLIACCMVFVACGKDVEKENNVQATENPTDELKISITDFCSNAETFNSMVSIALADNKGDFSECEGYYKEMEDIYETKIKDVKIDSVHTNDITEGAADIVQTAFTLLNVMKSGNMDVVEHYEFYQENQDHIKEKCEEIKSYI